MRALVTGISGQIGWYLASLLNARGVDVWGLVPPQAGVHLLGGGEAGQVAKSLPFVRVVSGDALDPWSLLTALEESKPDVVYALGAVSQPGLASALPELLLQINSMGIVRLLEACHRVVPSAKVVHASSDVIFGAQPGGVQNEKTLLAPVTPYGLSKAWAHLAIQVARAKGQWAANAILFNATSPRQVSGLVPYVIGQVADLSVGRIERIVVNSLDLWRDWMFAGDVAEAFICISNQVNPEDALVASGQTRSLKGLLLAALGSVKLPFLVDEDAPLVARDPTRASADTRRLMSFGWGQKVPFDKLVPWLVSARLGAHNDFWPAEGTEPTGQCHQGVSTSCRREVPGGVGNG